MEQAISFVVTLLMPLLYPALPGQRIFALYLVAALVLAFVVYRLRGVRNETDARGTFLGFCFPKAIFAHRSALVDYRYFIVNRIAFGIFLGPFLLSTTTASQGARALLAGFFGTGGGHLPAGMGTAALMTVGSLLALDAAIFATHYLQHKVPFLWEFHKIHHSAEVLTPITVYRMHPVDDLFTGTVAGLMIGTVQGVLAFFHGAGVAEFQLLGLNAGLFLFYVAGYNLRHSHIWLSYPGWLSHLLVSPAQHQIHHSSASRHFDRNFGFIFAFWDWSAGTLYVPRSREKLHFGLHGGEERDYDGVWRLYAMPFVKLSRLARVKRRRGAGKVRT